MGAHRVAQRLPEELFSFLFIKWTQSTTKKTRWGPVRSGHCDMPFLYCQGVTGRELGHPLKDAQWIRHVAVQQIGC